MQAMEGSHVVVAKTSNKARRRGKATDGAVLRALRYREFGPRSSSLVAQHLSKHSGYKVHREHISAFENGSRNIPDPIIAAACKLYSVQVDIFPEYSARHFTATEATNPLVAWARMVARGASEEQCREYVRNISKEAGPLTTQLVTDLMAQGVRVVELPRPGSRPRVA